MPLSKAEQQFIKDGMSEAAPVLFLVSCIWMARELKVEPNFLALQGLSNEITDFLLQAPPRKRSSDEADSGRSEKD